MLRFLDLNKLLSIYFPIEPDLRKKLRVTLKNAQGLDEAGIDGGGISREFMSQLLRTAFDPNRGFFKTTTDELLYPSPQSALLVEDFTKHFYFIGRMLGKVRLTHQEGHCDLPNRSLKTTKGVIFNLKR